MRLPRLLVWLRVVGLPLGLALGLVLAQPGAAQTVPSDSAIMLARRDDAMRLINISLTAFSAVMGPEERAILDEIEFRIPLDYNMFRVAAYRDPGRVIDIDIGFLAALTEACEDWVVAAFYADHDPGIFTTFDAYLAYLDNRIDENRRLMGENPAPKLSFSEFAGMPTDFGGAVMSRNDGQEAYGHVYSAAFAFVLAHEIGHHVLGHVDAPPASGAESRARETEADRYAAELTLWSGFPAFGAWQALAIFAAIEGAAVDPDGTHPPASCRIVRSIAYTIDQIAANENSAHLLTPDSKPGGALYEDMMARIQRDCS